VLAVRENTDMRHIAREQALLDEFGRLGLEDRIGVIADKLPGIAYAPFWPAAQAQTIRHRTRAGCRRFEAGPIWVTPYAGKVRDRRDAFRPDRWPHRLPEGRRRRGCSSRQYRQPKEIAPLHPHTYLPWIVPTGIHRMDFRAPP